MNQRSKADDFVGIVGRYTIDLQETVHALGVIILPVLVIVWLYLNDGERRLSLFEGAIAIIGSVAAGWYLLYRCLRTVVADREAIVSTGPFGSFRQEIRIADIQSVHVGGFTRGIDVDFDIDGKGIRLVTNRRFHRAISETIKKAEKSATDAKR